MFGTVILDAFGQADAQAVADAIEYLCAPYDRFGWASAGVYAFFEMPRRETLYIGMASDLAIRFQQHTGLSACAPRCCKRDNLARYFEQHEKLGLALLLQSPIDQPDIPRSKDARNRAEEAEHTTGKSKRGTSNAYYAESVLLETYRARVGRLPLWNEAPGIKAGRVPAVWSGAIGFMKDARAEKAISGQDVPDLTARRTLRELRADPLAEGYEERLHGARTFIVNMGGADLEDGLAFLRRMGNNVNIPSEYLLRVPSL